LVSSRGFYAWRQDLCGLSVARCFVLVDAAISRR
jgi:hypothetical protein